MHSPFCRLDAREAFQRVAADFRRKRSTDCNNPALPTQFDCHKAAHRSIMGRAEYCWPSPCLNERRRSREGTPVNVFPGRPASTRIGAKAPGREMAPA